MGRLRRLANETYPRLAYAAPEGQAKRYRGLVERPGRHAWLLASADQLARSATELAVQGGPGGLHTRRRGGSGAP